MTTKWKLRAMLFTALAEGAATVTNTSAKAHSRVFKNRNAREERAGNERYEKSEEQDRSVEAQISLAGECIAWHGGDEALQHGVTNANSQGPADNREDQALRKKLGEDGAASGAECAANGQFLLAHHAARQGLCHRRPVAVG